MEIVITNISTLEDNRTNTHKKSGLNATLCFKVNLKEPNLYLLNFLNPFLYADQSP